MDRSPSPEPFREPEGMVTIDLNKQSPILCRSKISISNKKHKPRVLSGIIVILTFCLISFLTAIFVHLEDINWFSPKLEISNEKEIIPASAEHIKLELMTESTIDQQTCGLDFRYQYETQLSVCEKTQTFKDCCHIHLRSNLQEINDACAVIELLNLLTEYRTLFPYRSTRSAIDEYTESDSIADLKYQQKRKMETQKKIKSYLQTLNEPLRKELPALWNWIGSLFFNESLEPVEKTMNQNEAASQIYIEGRPVEKGPEITSGNPNSDSNQEDMSSDNHENQLNLRISPLINEYIQTTVTQNENLRTKIEDNTRKLSLEPNLNVENNEERYHDTSNVPLETEKVKRLSDNSQGSLLLNSHLPLNFHEETNKYVVSFPKYKTPANEEDNASSPLCSDDSVSNLSNEKVKHVFVSFTNGSPFKATPSPREQDTISVKSRKKRYQINDYYPEGIMPIDYQSPTMPEYSRVENSYGDSNPETSYTNIYQNTFNQNEGDFLPSKQNYYEETPPRTIYNSNLGISAPDSFLKEENEYNERYHSQTQPRNMESERWKELPKIQSPELGMEEKLGQQQHHTTNKLRVDDGIAKKSEDKKNFETTSTTQTSVERRSEKISTEEGMAEDTTKIFIKQTKNMNHKSMTNDSSSNDKFLIVPPGQKEVTKEFPTTTTTSDHLDATDSIQSINQIQANDKSIRVVFENTTINLTERKNKPHIPSTEINDADNKKEELHSSDFQRVSSNLDFRESLQQNDFIPKTKGNSFSGDNEEVRSIQNTLVNNCLYPVSSTLGSPYKYAVAYDNSQVLNIIPSSNIQKSSPLYVINPSVFSYLPPNPIVPHYGPTNQNYNPYRIVSPVATLANTNNVAHGGAIQVTGASGQYYICNPIPSPTNGNAVANVPGVEIRREVESKKAPNLQRSSDAMYSFRNRTRAALNCPMEEQSCFDGTKCISERHVCDNEVHCEDGSDEMFCSCRDRIGDIRLCDGYYDCPDGEDEKGCFGCAQDEISCDDWSRFRKGTCVPMEQRCDGIRNCDVTGKDEDDCSILTDHMGENNPIKISNAVGFLHRNFKGKWYPTCFGSELWAMDVCKTEAGPSNSAPKSHLVPTLENYDGEFISILPNQEMSLVSSCVPGRAAFVECPPLFCGLRMTIKNPYRPQEVDTSIEELMNNLNRDNILDEDFDPMRNTHGVSNSSSYQPRDFVLGKERVVGGKASQPAAWPWVVSIYKNGIFHCGGVIISELWVLTAAHCVDKYWLFYYEVQAGILRRFSYSPMEQSRWVVAAIAHEEYNKSNLKNDIALLKLSSPVRYNRYVRPICLPSEATAGQDFLRGPSPGTICTTVGWGAIVEHGTDPDHMREVQVPILKRCKHPEDEEGNEICAGLFEGGKDACQGDSGGPFMCQNPNNPSQWYLSGIVSHGEGCARPNEPGVYTRVSEYIGWIADNIREDNFFPRTPLAKCPGYVCKETKKCIHRKRRCDKFVDCLLGDDESNCENSFNNIFKNSRIFRPFFRSPEEVDNSRTRLQKNNHDGIVGAAIINAEDESDVTTEVLETTTTIDVENPINRTSLIHTYERIYYYNNNTVDPDVFRCNKMLQIIPLEKRCNKEFDCEDATDEKNCQCVDYLKLEHPESICDGIVDCLDQSDESICYSCEKDEFNCKMSKMCISITLRCDGIPDCTKAEDELDCVALTNGKTITLDSDLQTILRMSGILSVNSFGSWRPYCLPATNSNKSHAEVAANVCNYLGYEGYTSFKKLNVYNESLLVKSQHSMHEQIGKLNSSLCEGMYLWCTNTTTNINMIHRVGKNLKNELNQPYSVPWNAVIFAAGIYKCMGALLNDQWIITSTKCFDDILMYKRVSLSVSLGKGLKYLNVASPHEEIVRVTKVVEVNGSDIALLKLEHSVDVNRYIQPAHLSLSSTIPNRRYEDCMAVGIADDQIEIVLLRSNNTCSQGSKCFNAIHERNCSTNTWNGVIACNYGNGWYPASVFETKDGICGFLKPTKFTSIQHWAHSIGEKTKDNDTSFPSVPCDGYLCKLGNCIKIQEVCDGIPHCRMSEDENFFMCRNRENFCHLTHSCVCPKDHLTCANGLCIPKKKFCDTNNDCGDFSDEPSTCTCRSYLILAHPEYVCDGRVHCFDRSDEDPQLCPCNSMDFKCERSGQCIGNEMVCDGYKDCPDGEDENKCTFLNANQLSSSSGDVMTKVAGQMLIGCFLETPNQSELDKICENSGYSTCVDHHLTQFTRDSNTTLVPILNNFHVVWIRRDRERRLRYRMRTGNDAHLNFRKQTNCRRLYVKCI